MSWFFCSVCGREGISGVHPRVSYGDMDLGLEQMLLLVAGNITHSGATCRCYFSGIINIS